jgi:hypothetical protein
MKSVRAKCFSSTVERAPKKNSNTENFVLGASLHQQINTKPVHIKTQENDQSLSVRVQKPLKAIDIFSADSKANKMKSDSQVNIKALPPIPAYLFANPSQKKAYYVNMKSSAYNYKVKVGPESANVTQRIFTPICSNQTISARENNFNPNTQIKSACNSIVSSQTTIKKELVVDTIARYEHLSILRKRKSKGPRPNSEVAPKLNYFINAIHRTDFANPFEKRRRMLNRTQEAISMENSLLERHSNGKGNESFQRYKNCQSSPVKIKRDPSLSFMEPESPEYRHIRTSSMREPYLPKARTETKSRHKYFDNSLKSSMDKTDIQQKIMQRDQENLFTQSDANDLNEYVDMRKNTPLELIEFSRRF